ncbi:hypothetical protein OHA25_36990 [Nonomuraea sp. NBC_00507]|uniref:hypothetical protein n=1 Tax=Nonomuraea sp. NBC_00507 TaxID=2976002 RepID=UPI002E19598E
MPTLLWRRTRPLRMLAIAFVPSSLALVATSGVGAETYTQVLLLLLVYALMRCRTAATTTSTSCPACSRW